MYEDHIGIKCTFVCFNVFILCNIIHMLILYLLLPLKYVLIIIYIYNLYQIKSINLFENFIRNCAKIYLLIRYIIYITHLSHRDES